MSIITRTVNRIAQMIRPIAPRFAKAAPYLWNSAAGKPAWSMLGSFLTFVSEGYEQNPLIYQALMYKVRAAAATRLRAQIGTEGAAEPAPETHPLAKLLARPNEHQSWVEFESMNILALNLAGNAFIYLDRGTSGTGPVTAMYGLRPDRVRIIPTDTGIKGFVYIPQGGRAENGVPLLPDQVMHVKLPNPRDEYEGMGYGMSPMLPLSQSTDVDNGFTRFIQLMVQNGLMPSGILKFDVPLLQEQVDQAKARFMQKYGGVENWNDVIVLDNGGDYKPLAQSFKDIDFTNIDKRTETRILGVLGVPTILLETVSGLQNSTYSNKAEARKAFWEDTMTFELNIFDIEYAYFLNQPGVFVQRDYSGVPALQKNVPALVDAAYKLWTMGVPANQATREVGLKLGDIPGGDVAYLSGSIVVAGSDAQAAQSDAAAARLAAGTDAQASDSAKKKSDALTLESGDVNKLMHRSEITRSEKAWSAAKKKALWKAVDAIATSHMEPFGEAAVTAFKKDKRAILAMVQKAKEKALYQKATIDWLSLADDVTTYFRSSETIWQKTFLPAMSALVEDTGNFWALELGTTFDVRNLLGEAWFQDYSLTFAQPISATSSEIVHGILAQAQAEGWSIYTMTERMGLTFDQMMNGDISAEDMAWMQARNIPYRREMIARTEITRLQGSGAQALFTQWDINKKEWLATQDDRCRPTHLEADGQQVNMDKPFSVGGYDMMHPGDMSLGAPVDEIVFCRCTTLPIVE